MTPPDRPFTAGRIGWACMIENAGAMQLTVSSGGDGMQLPPGSRHEARYVALT